MTTSLLPSSSIRRPNAPQVQLLHDNWTIISSASVSQLAELHSAGWTHPDSHSTSVPQTVFAAHVEDGTIADPFYGKNLEDIDKDPYKVSWIYRTEFDLNPELPADFVELVFEGINYRANVWLNGIKIAESQNLENPFRIYSLEVTESVRQANNILVVEVFPPGSEDLTIGWVDWNPYPPDNNLGIWRPVKLRQTGPVSLDGMCIRTPLDLDTLARASVEISGILTNHSNESVSGEFASCIEEREIRVPYKLEAGESMDLFLDGETNAELVFENPGIWWPHLMGDQPLCLIDVTVLVNGQVSDTQEERFGFRHVEDYINEQGHRGWKINGKEILIRGGGWRDDLFLRESRDNLEAQVRYTRHMNLNTIRMEGFWGSSKEIFNLCDEYGILLMIGWSCHWEWEGYCNREEDGYILIKTPEEMEFQSESFKEQAIWLRNHPSVLMWVFGADMIPRPELERELRRKLHEVDPGRPCLAGCRQISQDGNDEYTSEVSGPVAVKMVGPYSYVTPNYWFEDRSLGGAFGFNTETGPGMQPVVYESLVKFTPKENLWPMDQVWDFHTGKSAFSTFDYWLPSFNARYGEAQDAKEFCYWAQVSNYEAIRAMFESFAINKPEATGVIQWMLNSSMPTHLWQVYDYYLMPTGAFYGTQTACRPLNAVYNLADRGLYLTSEFLYPIIGVEVDACVYDKDSKLVWSKSLNTDICQKGVIKLCELPQLEELESNVYFLDVSVSHSGNEECIRSFYWLSRKQDVCDYEASDWHRTPNTQFADFRELKKLPTATVTGCFSVKQSEKSTVATVQIKNTSEKIAFFIELKLQDTDTSGTILPVFWQDNYVSLLPGEKRTLVVLVNENIAADKLKCLCNGTNLSRTVQFPLQA